MDSPLPEAAAPSRREQAKDGRRARILAAAHTLISESGVDAMAMKQVAQRAEVSLSTVYNLFESKEEILHRVFTDAFAGYRAAVAARSSSDPLERFFDAVDIAAEFYEADVPFYRSMVWLVGRESQLKLSIQEPRFEFYSDLVRDAVRAGLLVPDADPVLLGSTIVPLYSFAYQTWAAGAATIDEFRIRAKFGIVVVLKASAAPEMLPRLDEHLAILQAWLSANFALRRKSSRPA